ncbi:Ion channel [Oesophagostomum dentatum]|uniref:Ion channel n=1 Tax=Oesophagostomum dentatum TaxID=61180 RepID=A0A0B1TQ34_OESDE|nr:Ion channel [Oesophagostomum dentatum]
MLVVRVLRVLRMARVFKLARYSSSLQTFGHTLKSSITELSMLSMFLLTGIIFFSTIMYYLEKDEPHSDFYSIPAACWWCVRQKGEDFFSVTMATVGYGDAKPVTAFGKLVATATSICGIIVLAFPISMIVEKFASAQQKAIEDEQINQASLPMTPQTAEHAFMTLSVKEQDTISKPLLPSWFNKEEQGQHQTFETKAD